MCEPTLGRLLCGRAAARDNYDRLSRWYDLLAGSSERRPVEVGLRRLDAQPGERVLEIGHGTGHALVELARAVGPAGLVCGMDLSAGMGRVAAAKVRRAGSVEGTHSSPVRLVRGDAACLPFQADCLDALFMSFTLELFPAPEMSGVLGECWRVLRPGGRLGVVSLAQGAGRAVRLYEWAHRALPGLIDCRPILVQQALLGAGFQIADQTKVTMWGLPVVAVVGKKEPAPLARLA